MAIQERFRRLGWIGLHEAGIRLWQVHAEEVEFAANADGFAKIHLRMAGWMRKWHERLASSGSGNPDSVTVVEAMLVAQPLKDPLRMPLLHRTNAVNLQDRCRFVRI